jgi:DNA adenine methylase
MKPAPLKALYYMGAKTHQRHLILPTLRPYLEQASEFREPFVGSGAIALAVMAQYPRLRYWLNDRDPAVACLWWAQRHRVGDLVKLIEDFTPTPEAFEQFKSETECLANCPDDPAEIVRVGFMKFARHQTSHSGYGCGVRGGKEQFLHHKIDARWNVERIKHSVLTIGNRLNRCDVKITGYDWEKTFEDDDPRIAQFLDPPYLMDSEHWQQNYYSVGFSENDHQRLAERLRHTSQQWVLTLGDHYRVWDLYGWGTITPIAPRILLLKPPTSSEMEAEHEGKACDATVAESEVDDNVREQVAKIHADIVASGISI